MSKHVVTLKDIGRSRTSLKPWESICVCSYVMEIITTGFLRWCEMDFAHPQYVHLPNDHRPANVLCPAELGAAAYGRPDSSAQVEPFRAPTWHKGLKISRIVGLQKASQVMTIGTSRSSSREVRIRAPTFSFVDSSRGTLPTKKEMVKGHLAGGPRHNAGNGSAPTVRLMETNRQISGQFSLWPWRYFAIQDWYFFLLRVMLPPD